MPEAFSFLPTDKTTEPLKELGETIKGIHAQKIAVLNDQRKQLESLFDITMEGMMQGHQKEVMDDITKLREDATNVYANAGKENRIPNLAEVTDLQRKKKEIALKVNASQIAQQNTKLAINDMMMIKRTGGQVDPESEKVMDDLIAHPPKVFDTPDARLFVQKAYDFDQMDKEVGGMIKGTKQQMSYAKDPKTGKFMSYSWTDPQPIIDTKWKNDNRFRNYWISKAGGNTSEGKQMADEYGQTKASEQERYGGGNPSQFGYLQLLNYQRARPALERTGNSIPVGATEMSNPVNITVNDFNDDGKPITKNISTEGKISRIFIDSDGKMKYEQSVKYSKPVTKKGKPVFSSYATGKKIQREEVDEPIIKDFTTDIISKLSKNYDVSAIMDMWEEANHNQGGSSKAAGKGTGKIAIPGLKVH